MTRMVFVAALGTALASSTGVAQEPRLNEVAARVGEYVAGYNAQLAAVVAEETYIQTVDPPASEERRAGLGTSPAPDGFRPADRQLPTTTRRASKRTLRSDYALVSVAGRDQWVGYRDTFEVDGFPVRDREERLQRVLATGALEQAERIAQQNARFNLAGELLTRNINVPTVALELLHPRQRDRFSVRHAGSEIVNGRQAWVLEFRERGRPTIVRTPERGDQPSRVLAVVDPVTGTVSKTTLSWEKVTGSVIVTYGLVPRISPLVPLTMSERYTTREGATIAGEAIYANYRQFQTAARVIEP